VFSNNVVRRKWWIHAFVDGVQNKAKDNKTRALIVSEGWDRMDCTELTWTGLHWTALDWLAFTRCESTIHAACIQSCKNIHALL